MHNVVQSPPLFPKFFPHPKQKLISGILTVVVLMCLASFTEYDFKVHPCCNMYHHFIPFNG